MFTASAEIRKEFQLLKPCRAHGVNFIHIYTNPFITKWGVRCVLCFKDTGQFKKLEKARDEWNKLMIKIPEQVAMKVAKAMKVALRSRRSTR